MHGDEKQFRALVEYALQTKPNVVIIGGELLPRGFGKITPGYPYMQRKFAQERLPALLRPIKQNLPDTPIYVIPGNDDCSVNDDVLNEENGIFTNIDGKRVPLPGGLEIVGCSLVPFTPFVIKDREVFDGNENYKRANSSDYLKGAISVRHGNKLEWSPVEITEANRGQSLRKVLTGPTFSGNYAKTVYLFHTPPVNALDFIYDRKNVGSVSVREFIEKNQPALTLHGHIHETVDMTGEYNTQIGSTICMAAGNEPDESKLAVLTFDLDNLADVKRIKLPSTFFGKLISRIF